MFHDELCLSRLRLWIHKIIPAIALPQKFRIIGNTNLSADLKALFLEITVFGLGFVGLTTAVGFAEKGIKVYGIDVNEERTAVIREGRLPFFEPGLDEALVRNLKLGN